MRPHTQAPAVRGSLLGLLAVAAGALAMAGCGRSSKSSSTTSTTTSAPSSTTSSTPAPATSGGASEKLTVAADPEGQLKYTTSSLTAKAGTATITFTNSAPLAHNLTIASSSGSEVGATPTFQGGSKALTVKLTPGTYKFYCTVPGHRAAGMEGTLTVQ